MKLQRVYAPYRPGQVCSVAGCVTPAVVTVALIDGAFREQDMFTPFLCGAHLEEDRGRHRDPAARPFTNRCFAKGRTEYLPLDAALRQTRRAG